MFLKTPFAWHANKGCLFNDVIRRWRLTLFNFTSNLNECKLKRCLEGGVKSRISSADKS